MDTAPCMARRFKRRNRTEVFAFDATIANPASIKMEVNLSISVSMTAPPASYVGEKASAPSGSTRRQAYAFQQHRWLDHGINNDRGSLEGVRRAHAFCR